MQSRRQPGRPGVGFTANQAKADGNRSTDKNHAKKKTHGRPGPYATLSGTKKEVRHERTQTSIKNKSGQRQGPMRLEPDAAAESGQHAEKEKKKKRQKGQLAGAQEKGGNTPQGAVSLSVHRRLGRPKG